MTNNDFIKARLREYLTDESGDQSGHHLVLKAEEYLGAREVLQHVYNSLNNITKENNK